MAPPWLLAQGRCSSNPGCAPGSRSLSLGLDAGRTKEWSSGDSSLGSGVLGPALSRWPLCSTRYLALVSALASGADWLFIPEAPPEDGWENCMCERLGQVSGKGELTCTICLVLLLPLLPPNSQACGKDPATCLSPLQEGHRVPVGPSSRGAVPAVWTPGRVLGQVSEVAEFPDVSDPDPKPRVPAEYHHHRRGRHRPQREAHHLPLCEGRECRKGPRAAWMVWVGEGWGSAGRPPFIFCPQASAGPLPLLGAFLSDNRCVCGGGAWAP